MDFRACMQTSIVSVVVVQYVSILGMSGNVGGYRDWLYHVIVTIAVFTRTSYSV